MKSIPVIAVLLSCFFLVQTGSLRKAGNSSMTRDNPVLNENKIDTNSYRYEKEVLPVLINNCSPCHFPGGKMYERLPFDKDTTIINHGEKILKRIGNDEKKAAIREFILQNRSDLR
jgi:hypothetical protein